MAIGLFKTAVVVIAMVAQSATATLSGTVADQTGAVVADVKVVIVNTDTRLERVATTSTNGTFTLPLLPAGRYRLTAQREGFAPIRSDVTLNAGDHVNLRLEFVIAALGESVSVTVPDRVLRSTERGLVVDRGTLEQLPLNGRSYHTLFQLAPGVTMVNQSSNPDLFSVNGQRTTSNSFTVDGVSANVGADRLGTGATQNGTGVSVGTTAIGGMNNLVPVEGLEEFRLTTSAYAPEFGRNSGASVQITTRSGTNQLRGSVFEQFRDDSFNANDWFANRNNAPKLEMSLHNFGAALGGPIVRDRLHYFAAYEGVRLRLPAFLITQVPSRAFRESVPASARVLVDAYPLPTGPDLASGLAEAAYGTVSPSESHSFSLRADHIASARQLFGRFAYSTSDSRQRGQNGNTALNTTSVDSSETVSVTAGTTWAGQRFSYEGRLNFTSQRAAFGFVADDFGGAKALPDSLFPSYTSRERSLVQLDISPPGGTLVATGQIGGSTQRQINVVGHVTWQQGDSTWKAGVDVRTLFPKMEPGEFIFHYRLTSLPSLARGQVDQFNFNQRTAARPLFKAWSGYVQLQRSLTSRATLMTGVRWDINPGPSISSGLEPTLVEIEPTTLQVRPRSGSPLWKTDFGGVAPRVSINYALIDRPGRTTVLRGGAGLYFDVAYGRAGGAFGSGHPFVSQRSFTAVTLPLTTTMLTPASSPPATPGTASAYSIPDQLATPRSVQWSVSLDRQLGESHGANIAVVGTRNTRMIRSSLLNLAAVNRDYQSIWVMTNEGKSEYIGLQTQLIRRLHRGMSMQLAYTLADASDNGSSDFTIVPPSSLGDPRSPVKADTDDGPALFDIRHAFSAALTLQDAGRGRGLLKAVRGWEFSVLAIARSAPPVHIFVTRNVGFGSFQFRPDRAAGEALYADDPSMPCGRRIRREAFVIPLELRQGNASRNEARGCSARQVDLAVRRRIHLGGRTDAVLSVEVFNVANWPNFDVPVGNLTSPLFGASSRLLASQSGASVTGLNPLFQFGGPRSMQLSARVTF